MAGGEAAEPTERTALASASVALRMDDSGSLRLKWLQGADRRGVCAFVGLLCISVVAGVLAVGMRRTTAGAPLSERTELLLLHEASSRREDRPAARVTPMNVHPYTINNAASGESSTMMDFTSNEFFEVYTDLIGMSYLEVHWQDHDLLLPSKIIDRYRSKTMAIVGWEVDMVEGEGSEEKSVPNHVVYHHHHVATWWGLPPQRTGRLHTTHNQTFTRLEIDPDNRPGMAMQQLPALSPGVKRVQVTNLVNGGESRDSFTGLPRGFVQAIEEPSTVRLTAMFINTLNPDSSGSGGRSGERASPRWLPKENLRPASHVHPAPTDCPCTDASPPKFSEPELAVRPYAPAQTGWCKQPATLAAEGNPSCHPDTYKGGLSCCTDGARLLNKVRSQPPMDTTRRQPTEGRPPLQFAPLTARTTALRRNSRATLPPNWSTRSGCA